MKLIAFVFLLYSCCPFLPEALALSARVSESEGEAVEGIVSATNSRRNNHYVITTVLFEPFLQLKEVNYAGETERYEGYVMDLAELLANKLGFDYTMRLVKDSYYGTVDRDGKWNGMIGELIRKEADIAIAPLTITSKREKVVDFTTPFMTTGISVMIKRPSLLDEGAFIFLYPFNSDLWFSILFCCIGVTIVFFIAHKFSSYDAKGGKTLGRRPSTKDIDNRIWNTLKTIMRQNSESRNRSLSKTIVGSVFFFFIVILVSLYTANFTRYLSSKRFFNPITNVDELYQQSDVQYGIIRGGSTQMFFQTSNSPDYMGMWKSMSGRENSLVSSSKEGVEMVRNSDGKYAFILEGVVNDYVNGRTPCDTARLGQDLNEVGYGVAVTKGREGLRDQLNEALLELKRDGTLNKIKSKWWFKDNKCKENGFWNQDLDAITLCNVAGLFYILIIGLILSLVVSVGEYCLTSKNEYSESSGELLDKRGE